MSRTDPQFNLRIPESLRDLVTASAKQNKRSATAEILDRLEKSFTETDEMGISDLDRMNPESPWHTSEPEDRITTRVSKEKLLASLEADKPVTKRDIDQAVMEAMMRAMDALDPAAAARLFPGQQTKGPRPRKRHPKE